MYPPPPPGQPPGYPPPGYPPPYQYPPGYAPYGYAPMPMKPQRSGVPRVVGVLAIIFSAFGLIGSLIWTFGPMSDAEKMHASDLDPVITWLWIWLVLSLGLFVLHLVGGILAVQYKPSGLKTLTWYAIAALALILVDVVLVNVLIPAQYRYDRSDDGVYFSVRTMHIAFSAMAAPWPIIALALVRGDKARQACSPSTAQQVQDVF